jgi:predicted DNA-binding ribbon-helix-helix protein
MSEIDALIERAKVMKPGGKKVVRTSISVDETLYKRLQTIARKLGCSNGDLADAVFKDAMPELEKKVATL